MRSLLLTLLFTSGLYAAPDTQTKPAEHQFVIGISPHLDRSVKDDVFRGIVRLVVEDLPLGSSVDIYDAFELKRITQVVLPNARIFGSAKARANQFAPAIGQVKQFLAADHAKPTHGRLDFQDAVRLPQFCDFLTENLPNSPGSTVSVLLLGSPLYQDAKEPKFSMVNGYFPSDGHLQATREQSVFGFSSDTNAIPLLQVHWVYLADPWASDLHREQVTRFWALYLSRRGAQLASFGGDLTTTLQHFRQSELSTPGLLNRWAVDTRQTKIEMVRHTRSLENTDWLTRDNLPAERPSPPDKMVGPLKIGIRWDGRLDLDLYATPYRGAETLFFQHTQSPEGYYYKDHRSSPGREYEFIEFESPVDLRELAASVNFYQGQCPGGPTGEVRIEFAGKIYSAPFSISASEGNRGRSARSQSIYWTKIPVLEVLGLSPQLSDARD